MGSQESMHYAALCATSEIKQQWRDLWYDYEASVAIGFPYFLVPKHMGDLIGNGALEDIATRFAIYSAQDIDIRYDPTRDAYVIGPMATLNQQFVFRTLKTIVYRPGITVMPITQLWSPTPNSSLPATKTKVAKSANAFLLYRRDKYAEYSAQNTESRNMPNKNFSAIAGQLWANETDEVKAEYHSRARKLKDRSNGEPCQGQSSVQALPQPFNSSLTVTHRQTENVTGDSLTLD